VENLATRSYETDNGNCKNVIFNRCAIGNNTEACSLCHNAISCHAFRLRSAEPPRYRWLLNAEALRKLRLVLSSLALDLSENLLNVWHGIPMRAAWTGVKYEGA
jgi:hypothetical protein